MVSGGLCGVCEVKVCCRFPAAVDCGGEHTAQVTMPPGCLMLIFSRKMCKEISSGFTTARGRRSAHIPMMHGENAVCPYLQLSDV